MQTFFASHDAAGTLLSLYVCTTGDTMLAAAAARTPVTHVTILVARRPCMRLANLVVRFHQGLLLILLRCNVCGARLTTDAYT